MVKQAKNIMKTVKIIPYVIKKLSRFHKNCKFYEGSSWEIMKKFWINSKKILENLYGVAHTSETNCLKHIVWNMKY